MRRIEAIYRHGVFEPLEPVDLREEERVELTVTSCQKPTFEEWMGQVRANREAMKERHGLLPDSTPDIAADRMR
jgi:predicted DNA-binding antitoxin AbrB/MazE fold protein